MPSDDPSNYWQQSRRPLVSLVFVLPLLIIYEGGVLALGPDAIHNGVEQWLRWLLVRIGFGQYLLLPALTIAVLLGWHHMTGQPWSVRGRVVYGMFLESIVWALVLFVLASAYFGLFPTEPQASVQVTSAENGFSSTAAKFIGFCGAGLYEELLFRLMLLPAVMWVVLPIVKQKVWAAAIAVVSTSLVFSAAHYVGAGGDLFAWPNFMYRALAGAFFAALFVARGFGIAAATHACYDVLVGMDLR